MQAWWAEETSLKNMRNLTVQKRLTGSALILFLQISARASGADQGGHEGSGGDRREYLQHLRLNMMYNNEISDTPARLSVKGSWTPEAP